MSRKSYAVLVAVLVSGYAVGAQGTKSFEVVSVRPHDPRVTDRLSSRIVGQLFEMARATVSDLIARAYKVDTFRVVAPEWMTKERFDVRATLPTGATARDVPDMLQAMLAERFGLRSHIEQRPLPVYELTVAPSGHKLKEVAQADERGQSFADGQAQPIRDKAMGLEGEEVREILRVDGVRTVTPRTSYNLTWLPGGAMRLEASRIAMDEFITYMKLGVDRPVVDRTGLLAVYAFTTLLPPPIPSAGMRAVLGDRPDADPSGVDLRRSLKELGLMLEAKEGAAPVVVVDDGHRPTPN